MDLAVSDDRYSGSSSFLVVPRKTKVGVLVSVCVRRTNCGVRVYVVDAVSSRYGVLLQKDFPCLGMGTSSAVV